MRIPGLRRKRGDEAYQGAPTQIICPVCGLRNDSMARFCRNCGLPLGAPRDPVRGTVSRRADLPSEHGSGIAAIVGLAAAVVVLAGAAFLILRGSGGSGGTGLLSPTPAGSPRPTAASSRAPATGLPTRAPSSPVPSAGPVASSGPIGPGASGDAIPTRRPRESTSPAPEGSAKPLVADTGFTCDPASFTDPTRGAWRVSAAQWGDREKWDEVTLILTREEGRGRTAIEIEAMTPGEAERLSGLAAPPGDRALLIRFDGDTVIRQPIVASADLRAVEYLNVEMSGDTMYAVIGVNTDGCYRLFSPEWKRGDETATGETVRLLLDVRYR
jgi:hypothetical protein